MKYQPLVCVHDSFGFSFQQIAHIDWNTLNVSLGEVLRRSISIVYLTLCQNTALRRI